MMDTTRALLHDFTKIEKEEIKQFRKYAAFDFVREHSYKGSGPIGNGGHLILWDASELEVINDEYCVDEFLTDIFLIGSDGSGDAYGVNLHGEYIAVPFIGMCDEDVKVVGKSFDDFIAYVATKE